MSTTHGHHHQQLESAPDTPDAWHTHTTAEPAPQAAHASDIDFRKVFWLGVIGFLIIGVTTQATWEYFKYYATQLRQQREETEVTMQDDALRVRREALFAEQRGPVGYVVAGDYIRVPVDVAGQKVMERYAKR